MREREYRMTARRQYLYRILGMRSTRKEERVERSGPNPPVDEVVFVKNIVVPSWAMMAPELSALTTSSHLSYAL